MIPNTATPKTRPRGEGERLSLETNRHESETRDERGDREVRERRVLVPPSFLAGAYNVHHATAAHTVRFGVLEIDVGGIASSFLKLELKLHGVAS